MTPRELSRLTAAAIRRAMTRAELIIAIAALLLLAGGCTWVADTYLATRFTLDKETFRATEREKGPEPKPGAR